MYQYERDLLQYINNLKNEIKAQPLYLGGVSGEAGGDGGPPAGFVGRLIQSRVAYDETELATDYTPISGVSLVDNLNHIRNRLAVVEASGVTSSGGGGHLIQDDGVDLTQRAKLNFVGGGVTVVDDLGNNATIVTIPNGVDYSQINVVTSANVVSKYPATVAGLEAAVADAPTGSILYIPPYPSVWYDLSTATGGKITITNKSLTFTAIEMRYNTQGSVAFSTLNQPVMFVVNSSSPVVISFNGCVFDNTAGSNTSGNDNAIFGSTTGNVTILLNWGYVNAKSDYAGSKSYVVNSSGSGPISVQSRYGILNITEASGANGELIYAPSASSASITLRNAFLNGGKSSYTVNSRTSYIANGCTELLASGNLVTTASVSDRSDYFTKIYHSKDLHDSLPTYHVPEPTVAGKMLLSTGTAPVIWSETTMSGDGTISSAGVLAINKTRLNVRNETGSTIAVTKAVYASGFNNLPLISLADNTDEIKHNVIGVTTASIADQANGVVATNGQCDAETNAWNVGTELYLSTAGALVPAEPTAGAVIHVGIVMVKENYPVGKILLYNLPEGNTMAAGAAQDLIIRMGDSIGAKKVSFRDYANTEVAYINSDGAISGVSSPTFVLKSGDTMTGALTNTLATGNSLVWDTNTLIVDATNHRVGIGTTAPLSFACVGLGAGTLDGFSIRDGTAITSEFFYSTVTGENRIGGVASYAFPTFYSGGNEAMRILTTGQVGIGTTAPNSYLHVAGSLTLPISTVKTSAYTVTASDFTIRCNATSVAAFTVSLPTAVGIAGRIYVFLIASATNAVTIDPAGSETIGGSTTASYSDVEARFIIQSDGANWVFLSVL